MAKRPSLRKNLDADKAAEAAAAIAEKPKTAAKKARSGDLRDEPHSTQSYHLPTHQINLMAQVAMKRAIDARNDGQKGHGRISASGVLRELIEPHIQELQDELDGK